MLKRLSVFFGVALGLVLIVGAGQAGASGSKTVLTFHDTTGTFTGIGFDANNPNAIPPVGSQEIITTVLENIGAQFGKPSGAKVGRALLDCTVLVVNMPQQTLDGECSGIAHVPNGYFTFGGNAGLSDTKVSYYDITGGDGPYANDRGEIKVVDNKNGTSTATVTLDS